MFFIEAASIIRRDMGRQEGRWKTPGILAMAARKCNKPTMKRYFRKIKHGDNAWRKEN